MSDNPVTSSPSTRPNILLVNFHSSQNAGDLALLEAAIDHLQRAFPEPHIVISANYPDETYFDRRGLEVVASPAAIIYNTSSSILQIFRMLALWLVGWLAASTGNQTFSNLLPVRWRKMLEAYKEADLVIGCPGNQFFSMGKVGWPLIISGLSIQLAYHHKKPFYVMPQSLGPLKRSWERRWMRHLYGKARLVYLRDSISMDLAQEIELPKTRLHLVSDLAFGREPNCLKIDPSILEKSLVDSQSGKIGVTVISRMVKSLDRDLIENYYRVLARALSNLSSQFDLEIFFLPQVTGPSNAEDDRLAARQVATMMEIPKSRIHLVEEGLRLEELKSLYQYLDIFTASRLHSGIFALNVGVPTLFIGYLTKTRGILQDLGLDEWQIDLNTVTEQTLTDKMQQLWLQRAQVHLELLNKIPAYAAKSNQVGDQIYQDYLRDHPN